MRYLTWFIVIVLLVSFATISASACQYNVRDIGFTDLDSEPYRLYYYIGQDTPPEYALIFREIATAALIDANIEFEAVNVDQQQEHPGLSFARFWEFTSFPGAVLVSPQGPSLVIPIPSDKSAREAAWEVMDSVAASPRTRQVLRELVKSYCVVLLVHGKDEAQNRATRVTVQRVMEQITQSMPQLPKTIDNPPQLMEITPDELQQERVLLWSLGVDTHVPSQPAVAILYGRGRRMGPLLTGSEITGGTLLAWLSYVGASCECGLERRWMLGPMIPGQWSVQRQSEVVELLGFDADSPVVKAEVQQILSIGPNVGGSVAPGRTVDLLQTYSEQTLDFDPSPSQPMVSPAQLQSMTVQEAVPPKPTKHRFWMFMVMGGVILVVLTGSAVVLWRARGRA